MKCLLLKIGFECFCKHTQLLKPLVCNQLSCLWTSYENCFQLKWRYLCGLRRRNLSCVQPLLYLSFIRFFFLSLLVSLLRLAASFSQVYPLFLAFTRNFFLRFEQPRAKRNVYFDKTLCFSRAGNKLLIVVGYLTD